MGTGTEIILGFPFSEKKRFKYFSDNIFKNTEYENINILDDISKLKKGIKLQRYYDKTYQPFQIFQNKLIEAQKECFKHVLNLEDSDIIVSHMFGIKRKLNNTYVTDGISIFSLFEISYFYNHVDMKESKKEIIIGISLTGYHVPVFLDYNSKYEGLYPLILNSKMKKLMNTAKKLISKQIPVFERAVYCIKEMHY